MVGKLVIFSYIYNKYSYVYDAKILVCFFDYSVLIFSFRRIDYTLKCLWYCKENTCKIRKNLFCVSKVPVLRCNIGTFTVQYRRFCNAKQGVLQNVAGQMVTRMSCFCKIFTFLWGGDFVVLSVCSGVLWWFL